MLAVPDYKKPQRVRSLKSSGSRVTSRPLPPQWRTSGQKKARGLPLLMRLFLLLQRTSSLITLGAVGTTLVMYGLTVYTQQLWNQQYQKLQDLQRHERTITSINEGLKEEIASSGNLRKQGFVPLTPDKNIYLQSEPIPESSKLNSSSVSSVETPQTDRPIAY